MEELIGEARLIGLPGKDPIDPKILRTDVRTQVFPCRMLRIFGRLHRVRPDMAEGARHSHAIGLHEVLGEIVGRILVIALRIPFPGGLFVEFRIGEQPKSDDTAGITVERSDRQILPPCTDPYARVLRFVLKRVGWASRAYNPLVEPEPEPIRIRSGAFFKTWFIDQTKIVPSTIAAVVQIRMRRQCLQKIERPETAR